MASSQYFTKFKKQNLYFDSVKEPILQTVKGHFWKGVKWQLDIFDVLTALEWSHLGLILRIVTVGTWKFWRRETVRKRRTRTCRKIKTRMWVNAQRDGRPAEHRWRPLFNVAKIGGHPLLDCRAV